MQDSAMVTGPGNGAASSLTGNRVVLAIIPPEAVSGVRQFPARGQETVRSPNV